MKMHFDLIFDDGNKNLSDAELAAHYEALRSSGWRATRWEHVQFGTMERSASGSWKNTNPNGVAVEYAFPGKAEMRISGAKGVVLVVDDKKETP